MMTARLSWVAYIPYLSVGFLLYFCIVLAVFPMMSYFGVNMNKTLAVNLLIVLTVCYTAGFLWMVYRVRRCKAFFNQDGVWYFKGVWPWTSKMRGIRWENFHQALYRQDAAGLFFKTYTIYLFGRDGSTVIIKNLYDGRNWSAFVNDYAQDRELST